MMLSRLLLLVLLAGAGFALPDSPAGPFTLNPGDSVPIQVQLLDPTQPASAALQVASDDPTQPTYSLSLQYDGTSIATSPQTTSPRCAR